MICAKFLGLFKNTFVKVLLNQQVQYIFKYLNNYRITCQKCLWIYQCM